MLDIFIWLLSRDHQISAFQYKVNYQHFFLFAMGTEMVAVRSTVIFVFK